MLRAGFNDEAFGMTRTLLDIYITLRYIANKDTDERARRDAEFSSKDAAVWNEVVKTYWPHRAQTVPTRTLRIAAKYRSPHQWSGKNVKEMALEPDTVEIDPKTGKPVCSILLIRSSFDGLPTMYTQQLALLKHTWFKLVGTCSRFTVVLEET